VVTRGEYFDIELYQIYIDAYHLLKGSL